MRTKHWPLIAAGLLLGCERSPYAGYKVVGDDVHIHLLAIGDGETLAHDSDSVRVRLRMGHRGAEAGGLFSTERTYLVKDIRTGAFVALFRRAHVGDSISVIASSTEWPWKALTQGEVFEIPDSGMVQAEFALLELHTPAMMRAEADRLKRNDPLGYERRLIAAHLGQRERDFLRWGTSDVHYAITGTAKDTTAVVQGDVITISYRGQRIEDGQVFDDTGRNGAPLTFTFGDKDQVVNGIEVAVGLLREGQEGTFVLPSSYAFGEKGIPDVLDPYMPVVYTVRLVGVERASAKAER